MTFYRINIIAIFFIINLFCHVHAETLSARDIVKNTIDHWRGTSSYSEMTMTIHRPDWERTMSMRTWTEGEKLSLVRVTAPPKDQGSGSLMIDNSMWTYSPKVNRIIKIPSSMMNQSWMGSDFTNKDIAKADDIIDQFEHTLVSTEQEGGHTVYVIESIPYEDAAVVWGKQVLKVRDDHLLLEEQFYDQDGILVKAMTTLAIANMGGRTVAQRQRMSKADIDDEWTEVSVQKVEFDIKISDSIFTLSNLRNPRE